MALSLAVKAPSEAASHMSVVFECGNKGKTCASFEYLPHEAATAIQSVLVGTMQGGTPTFTQNGGFLGITDNVPPNNAPPMTQASTSTKLREYHYCDHWL